MNIGVCLYHDIQNMENSLRNMVSQGFYHCQLISWQPALWNTEQAEYISSLCSTYGVEITAFWCGWEGPAVWNFYDGPQTLGLLPESYRYARMKNLMDGADFAGRLGIQHIVSHMGFIPENPHDPSYAGLLCAIRTVALHLQSKGQWLLFETGQETPVTLLRAIEDIGTGNVAVNLDPANLILYGKANPVDALDVLGEYVKGVHAKDGVYPTNGRELGTEVPLGAGKVNFPLFLRKLKHLGYRGSLTIEREIAGEQQMKDVLHAKEYLEKLLEELNS